MKKIFSILLTLLLIFALSACGSSTNSSSSVEQSQPSKDESKIETISDNKASYALSNEVIVDNEYCSVTFTKVDEDNMWGQTIVALCENKTSDTTLMFSIDDCLVNGYAVDPFWATEIPAGKKENCDISFSSSLLEECGISTLDEVAFTLRVSDSDDWGADPFIKERYTVYPTGLTSSDIVIPSRPTNATEEIVLDNNQISFIILEQYNDDIWGYSLKVYLENKTDSNLSFGWNDVSVNGFMVDPFWACEVPAHGRYISSISFSDTDFEDNGIENVDQIEYTLGVYDSDNWSAPHIIDHTFEYNPQ